MFTVHVWISTDVHESYVIISDDLQHTKLSVHYYMSSLIQEVTGKHASITEIAVFADGASSQFKQRYFFSNINNWEKKFGVALSWHFFATSHGKGVVDGIGGCVAVCQDWQGGCSIAYRLL